MTRVAAIDCGTNSIRLLVADGPSGTDPTDGGELVDVVRRMEVVRLGEGVDRTGRLAPAAIERTRLALASYTAQLRDLGAQRVRMVATSASRDAENSADFRAMVLRTLGSEPEVVSGEEEALLSYTGAVHGLRMPGPYLVLDIGGGSTEFVVGGRTTPSTVDAGTGAGDGGGVGRPDAAISVDIGCVRMTERHLHSDPPTVAEVLAATDDITAQVRRALDAVDARRAATVVGLAGSVTTVAAIALGLAHYDPTRIHHSVIPVEQVQRVTADLLALTHDRRLALPVMHPGRADVIGAGALILRIILEQVGAGAVVVSEHDILDGIAWSALAAGPMLTATPPREGPADE
jgi:exopolyphosphatase / guanosine-5'-triphosphate,3'-diphosphate pyrophosphatase